MHKALDLTPSTTIRKNTSLFIRMTDCKKQMKPLILIFRAGGMAQAVPAWQARSPELKSQYHHSPKKYPFLILWQQE
jgi:hypothetical protein